MALPVERLNDRFEGEFTFRGKRHGVPFTLPGDLVQFQMERRGRRRSLRVQHVERAASYPDDIRLTEPFCAVYGRCGGCRAQHLDYDFQLRLKTDPIVNAMHARHQVTPEIRPTPLLRGYRGRMDFAVDGGSVGLRPVGDYASFVDIANCPVQSASADRVLELFRSILAHHPGVAWTRATSTGVVKYVTIRSGDGDPLAVLTVDDAGRNRPEYLRFREELAARVALVETTSDPSSEVSCPPGGMPVSGDGSFAATLGGRSFRVPYDAFFQPNPRAFDVLLDWSFARLEQSFAEPANVEPTASGSGLLMDLYSGMGVLSALCVDRFRDRFHSVRGIDFTESAVARAPDLFPEQVAVDFRALDLGRPPADLFHGSVPDLVIVDPPRAGLSPGLAKLLGKTAPTPLVLYISCNPRSQLQDLDHLTRGYRVREACIVDCFPYTPHLEQAVLLERRTDV